MHSELYSKLSLRFAGSHRLGVFIGYLGLTLFFVAPRSQARLNLPQRAQATPLQPDKATVVCEYFAQPRGAAAAISPSIEQLLVASLPQDFREACREVIAHWGTEVAGTEEWRVRLLYQQPNQVWMAFRCDSRRAELSQYHDERLALLRLDVDALELVPLGPDYENDSFLYRVELREPLALEGGEAVAFRVVASNDNPCCGGPDSFSEEKLLAFATSPRGAVQVLSLVTANEHYSHDDVEGDTETVYKAEVKFERNGRNQVIAASAAFREEVLDITWKGGTSEKHLKAQRTGTLRYRWNPASYRFEEAK